jgi:hypothetical protein
MKVDRLRVEALAQQAVLETAPEELALFPATSTAFFADPRRAEKLVSASSSDDMLGFGVDELMSAPTIATAALIISNNVLCWLAKQAGAVVEEESSNLVKEWVRRMLRAVGLLRREPEVASPAQPLSQEQLRQVRRIAQAEAERLRLPADKADPLVRSIVAELALESGRQ